MNKKLSPVNVNVVLEGRFNIIKPISINEVTEQYVSWLNNPEINQFLEVRHKKQTINDIVGYINNLRSRDGCELFAIFSKNNLSHIGNVAISKYFKNSNCVEFGTVIGELSAQKFGAGCEAEALLLDYLFLNLKIRKVMAGAISDNERSWKLLEHLGFIREGVLREHHVLSTGKITDQYSYGILRAEWLESRNKLANLIKDFKIIVK